MTSRMRALFPIGALLIAGFAMPVPSHGTNVESKTFPEPALLDKATQFSDQLVRERPELQLLLNKLGLRYLHQLDPDTVYQLNTRTGELTRLSRAQAASGKDASPAGIFWGFGTPAVRISGGTSINGEASTTVTCPFSAQTAEVSGFMASTVSRDPVAGVRNGTLVIDNALDSKAQVNFSILRLAGGARNSANRTTLESVHTGSCGDEVRVNTLVTTWPPNRVELAIDDTGSMDTQLSGVKSALASFVENNNSGEQQRATSYELISFKDAPTLRLPNTEDTAAVINAVQGLTASGGDDCPEDSLGAVSLALSRLGEDEDSEGSVILATDASPHSGDVDGLIAQARANGTRVHVLLSGDCVASATGRTRAANGNSNESIAATPSSRDVFSRIAQETGGLYFYAPNATSEVYADLLGEIFQSVTEGITTLEPAVPLTGLEGAAGSDSLFRVEVPTGTSNLRVLSYGGTGNVSLYMKRGKIPTVTDHDMFSTRPGNNETLNLAVPVAGTYYIRLRGESAYTRVSLQARVTK
ncbi:pre-peptidase C-terminal domain-containing protein [uncultured Xanthomonas sp.]|uniref:pre-peptidase C-terminal domain-containing protein n=1 Tax=uncultured Xanthomonas sp. TaxID=152831 RepID=UPI0025F6159B|nr:pre-peptidase C-terminal domain-containing protein [uncultured Xanthomonas sp.]